MPEELTALLQDSLHSFAAEMGRQVAVNLLEHEVTKLCGPRYQRPEGRVTTRYGGQPGVITLAGQKMAIRRPRVRAVGGKEARPVPKVDRRGWKGKQRTEPQVLERY